MTRTSSFGIASACATCCCRGKRPLGRSPHRNLPPSIPGHLGSGSPWARAPRNCSDRSGRGRFADSFSPSTRLPLSCTSGSVARFWSRWSEDGPVVEARLRPVEAGLDQTQRLPRPRRGRSWSTQSDRRPSRHACRPPFRQHWCRSSFRIAPCAGGLRNPRMERAGNRHVAGVPSLTGHLLERIPCAGAIARSPRKAATGFSGVFSMCRSIRFP